MKISVIVGSLRKESYNKKVAYYMKNRYKDVLDMEILDVSQIPLFNEDIEKDPPQSVRELKEKVKASDGVFLISPEYNHSIPGSLKNILDWFSRETRPMVKKPVLVLGCSQGSLGTVRGQIHLKQVLNSPGLGALNLPNTELLISNIQDKVDENNNLIDEKTINHLDRAIEKYIGWAKKQL